MENVSDWFKANKLKLNVGKTNCIIFSNRTKQNQTNIHLDGKIIAQVSNTKFLGLHLNVLMKWEVHVKYIEKKVASGLYALNSLKFYMPSFILRALYFALIHPYLTYGCILWGKTLKKFIHSINIMQKKAIRTINHAKYNASTSKLFMKSQILKFEDIHRFMTCQFMHKVFTCKVPSPLRNIMTQNLNIHGHFTRHRNDFATFRSINNTLCNSFIVEGPKLWNALPQNIKNLKYKQFSKKLRLYIIEGY